MADYAAILVHTTSDAIHAERVLKKAGLDVKLIPTPRHLSSDCGSAVRIPATDQTAAENALSEAGVAVDRVESL